MSTEITKAGQALDEKTLSAFEKETGYEMPDQYREFLLKYNGGKPVPKYFKVPGYPYEQSFVRDLKHLDGDGVDLRELNDLLKGRLPQGYLAIGTDPGGNSILLSLVSPTKGKIYFFDHENEPDEATDDLKDYPNIYLLAAGFDEFINSLKTEDEL